MNKLKVGIIGGGPAGCFAGHFLNKFSLEKGLDVDIDIYDYKSFSLSGNKSCNMCAGIISDTLRQKLEYENIYIPESIIKNEISGYQLHTKFNTMYIQTETDKKIYSIFRGGGPVKSNGDIHSFDQFLLNNVNIHKNISIINKKVINIDCSEESVTVRTEDGIEISYDTAIGAFGVNTDIEKIIKTDYKEPSSYKFLQFEVNLPEDFINSVYKKRVQMFPVYKNRIWFITLTPKWNFVTVTIIGKNVKLKDAKTVIGNNKAIKYYLPGKSLNIKCSCNPKLPAGFAKNPYNNRFIIIGDACTSRYLKNGIESAYETALLAADTIINHGFTKKIIKKYYFKKCVKKFRFDNLCGKILYFMNHLLFINPLYTEAHMFVLKKEQVVKKSRKLSGVFWNMFTGDREYKTILKNAVYPPLVLNVIKQTIFLAIQCLLKGRKSLILRLEKFHKLLNKGTVAIIGGGPGGSSCAIKLAKLAKEKNIKLNINLYESKDFRIHHNQCVGILSPPILKILKEELDISLPIDLIKSRIPGYELHTEKESIFLKNYRDEESDTFSVRRSEFDDFLLNCAREEGVKIINSRVTDIEFCKDVYRDEVRIFSESEFLKADAVVCAFGLDSDMMDRLNEATKGRYRKPSKIMKTFVTRFEYSETFLKQNYDKRIYAFLLSSIKNIEFGAVTIKNDHIVANIAGEQIKSVNLHEFINTEKVNNILPGGIRGKMTYYCGRFPSSPAKNPYGDRYVTVGDATGWLRPLKGKGINLAIITGINAAKVMINRGISENDFKKYKKLCRTFIEDYKYGVAVRFGLKFILKTGLMNIVIKLSKLNKKIYNMLYDAVSGENSYRDIFINFFKF